MSSERLIVRNHLTIISSKVSSQDKDKNFTHPPRIRSRYISTKSQGLYHKTTPDSTHSRTFISGLGAFSFQLKATKAPALFPASVHNLNLDLVCWYSQLFVRM